MPLTYGLYPNKMLKKGNSYRALIKGRNKYSLDAIAELISRRNPGFTKPEIKGILDLFMEEVSDILKEGGSVTTPLFKAQCSIAGSFDGADDYFSSNRHQVRASLKPGTMLREMASQVRPKKTKSNLPRPHINQITDMSTGEVNSSLTPGGPVVINGSRLQFDPDDPDQGVFLVNEAQKYLRITPVFQNSFSSLMLMIPADLQTGTYRLLVKSDLNTQTIRTGELDRQLVV